MSTIKTREEISPEFKWSITDLFECDEAWEKAYAEYSAKTEEFSAFMPLSLENLAECLTFRDETAKNIEQIYVYANLKSNEDSTNTKYQAFTDRTDALLARYSAAAAFIEPSVLSLDEPALLKALESDELKIYKHYINIIQ